MHSNERYSKTPLNVVQSLWRNRQLIWQLATREVIGRYRGSFLGLLWSFFNPLLLLCVYTFVFSVVFRAKWHEQAESHTEFAVMLFAGLIVYSIFAECVNRAPGLILGNVNYVKKVVFPLESLPWVIMGATVFHSLVSVLVLVLMSLSVHGAIHWTVILFPLVVFPLVLVTMGLCWFLASLGIFLRDLGQVVLILTTALIFMTPVFYPAGNLPDAVRPYVLLNPLSFVIEQARAVLIRGELPNWPGLACYAALSIIVAWLGLLWFQKTRHGFADVL